MNKSNIESGQAGTEEQQSTTAQDQQVSQPNANTNVVGIPFKSREIKFRAWLIPDDDFESELPYMTYDLAFEDYAPVNEQLKSVSTLMQYTGLKDKNGKEIYEGDIRRVKLPFWSYYFIAPFHPTGHDGYSTIDGICEVVFNDGEFKYKVNKVLPETSAWFDEYKLDKYFSGKLMSISCESILIGNVFENSELLHSVA